MNIDEKEEESSDPEGSRRTNEKLLTIALGLLPEQAGALNPARSSLRYSASLSLPLFLFKLAEVNNALADQFYEEALATYVSKPMGGGKDDLMAFYIRRPPLRTNHFAR